MADSVSQSSTTQSGKNSGRGQLRPRIVVFGVGGAGGNAVANMISSGFEGVSFVVANTDAQALDRAAPDHRLQLGPAITEGLGAGARPDIGRRAAEDSVDEISEKVEHAHMVFITAGMGGGTGTGAAPVIARIARDAGALTIAVVTKPFEFEGVKRMGIAEEGLEELAREVDTLIVIPNQNLFRIATEKTTMSEAFSLADQVLHAGVRGVTDLMMRPGVVNLDFADVRTVMNEMGQAVMGSGQAEGPRRAVDAASKAMANPLLDDVTLKGAKAVLLNITGGPDLTLYEIDEAANTVRAEIDPKANIIFGSAVEEGMEGKLRVSIVATGINAGAAGAGAAGRSSRAPKHGLPFADKVAAAGFTFEPPVSQPKPAQAPKEAPKADAPKAEAAPEKAEKKSGKSKSGDKADFAFGKARQNEPAPEEDEAEAPELSEAKAAPWSEPIPDYDDEPYAPNTASGAAFGRRGGADADEPAREPEPELEAPVEAEPARPVVRYDDPLGDADLDEPSDFRALMSEDEPEEPVSEDWSEAVASEPAEPEASSEPDVEAEAEEAESVEVRRMTPEEESTARSGGFSLFGRRKRRPEPKESKSDEAGRDDDPEAAGDDSGGDGEDLEIPAFLRRQAN